MNWKIIAAGLCLVRILLFDLQAVHGAPADIFSHPESIKGIVGVRIKHRETWWQVLPPERKHWYSPFALKHYLYEVDTGEAANQGERFESILLIQHVKDLREYSDKWPKAYKLQQGCNHWQPVASVLGSLSLPVSFLIGQHL